MNLSCELTLTNSGELNDAHLAVEFVANGMESIDCWSCFTKSIFWQKHSCWFNGTFADVPPQWQQWRQRERWTGQQFPRSTKNTCRPAQGPIMGPGGDIFSGTFRETCQLPESGSGLKQRGKWVPQPRQQSGVTLVSFAWQLPLRSQKTSNNAHSEIIISR